MSIYRDKRSLFYRYDFEIDGYRFSASTKCRDEHNAQEIENVKKIEARKASTGADREEWQKRMTTDAQEPKDQLLTASRVDQDFGLKTGHFDM